MGEGRSWQGRRWCACLTVGLVATLLAGCGADPAPDVPAVNDATILTDYLRDNPDLPAMHHAWHDSHARLAPNYGVDFVMFHRGLVQTYEAWRAQHGYGALLPWDPGTPIPPDVPHPGRATNDPSAVDPLCRRPAWLTLAGGQGQDPDTGARRLIEYATLNQLGKAIDAMVTPNWHSRVHETIGGDMATPHNVPLDPIFWRWHKFIDQLVMEWQQADAALTGGP